VKPLPLPAGCDWLHALREPAAVAAWDAAQWERVIRLARRLRLLARLGEAVAAAQGLDSVPPAAARHLLSEMRLARWQTRALAWTAERVATALDQPPYAMVLLKGGAYVAEGRAIGRGRLPSDLDVMVPRRHLADAQQRLMAAGWREVPLDEHDRRYYHEWSHEAPPMRHPAHSLELDLHHNILPPVARLHVNADLLFQHARPSPWAGWQVLQPIDQILHSATHLFQDPDLTDRVRDLLDLDALCREQSVRAGFWSELAARARELGLGGPLWLALCFLRDWFHTPVPAACMRDLDDLAPGPLQRRWLLPALQAVLSPALPDGVPAWSARLGARAVLTRHHLGRLPLRLLLPHAWHKLRGGKAVHASAEETDLPRPMRVDEPLQPVQPDALR